MTPHRQLELGCGGSSLEIITKTGNAADVPFIVFPVSVGGGVGVRFRVRLRVKFRFSDSVRVMVGVVVKVRV